jgi:hypothetical protein
MRHLLGPGEAYKTVPHNLSVLLPEGTTLFHGTLRPFEISELKTWSWFATHLNSPIGMLFEHWPDAGTAITWDKVHPRIYEMITTKPLHLELQNPNGWDLAQRVQGPLLDYNADSILAKAVVTSGRQGVISPYMEEEIRIALPGVEFLRIVRELPVRKEFLAFTHRPHDQPKNLHGQSGLLSGSNEKPLRPPMNPAQEHQILGPLSSAFSSPEYAVEFVNTDNRLLAYALLRQAIDAGSVEAQEAVLGYIHRGVSYQGMGYRLVVVWDTSQRHKVFNDSSALSSVTQIGAEATKSIWEHPHLYHKAVGIMGWNTPTKRTKYPLILYGFWSLIAKHQDAFHLAFSQVIQAEVTDRHRNFGAYFQVEGPLQQLLSALSPAQRRYLRIKSYDDVTTGRVELPPKKVTTRSLKRQWGVQYIESSSSLLLAIQKRHTISPEEYQQQEQQLSDTVKQDIARLEEISQWKKQIPGDSSVVILQNLRHKFCSILKMPSPLTSMGWTIVDWILYLDLPDCLTELGNAMPRDVSYSLEIFKEALGHSSIRILMKHFFRASESPLWPGKPFLQEWDQRQRRKLLDDVSAKFDHLVKRMSSPPMTKAELLELIHTKWDVPRITGVMHAEAYANLLRSGRPSNAALEVLQDIDYNGAKIDDMVDILEHSYPDLVSKREEPTHRFSLWRLAQPMLYLGDKWPEILIKWLESHSAYPTSFTHDSPLLKLVQIQLDQWTDQQISRLYKFYVDGSEDFIGSGALGELEVIMRNVYLSPIVHQESAVLTLRFLFLEHQQERASFLIREFLHLAIAREEEPISWLKPVCDALGKRFAARFLREFFLPIYNLKLRDMRSPTFSSEFRNAASQWIRWVGPVEGRWDSLNEDILRSNSTQKRYPARIKAMVDDPSGISAALLEVDAANGYIMVFRNGDPERGTIKTLPGLIGALPIAGAVNWDANCLYLLIRPNAIYVLRNWSVFSSPVVDTNNAKTGVTSILHPMGLDGQTLNHPPNEPWLRPKILNRTFSRSDSILLLHLPIIHSLYALNIREPVTVPSKWIRYSGNCTGVALAGASYVLAYLRTDNTISMYPWESSSALGDPIIASAPLKQGGATLIRHEIVCLKTASFDELFVIFHFCTNGLYFTTMNPQGQTLMSGVTLTSFRVPSPIQMKITTDQMDVLAMMTDSSATVYSGAYFAPTAPPESGKAIQGVGLSTACLKYGLDAKDLMDNYPLLILRKHDTRDHAVTSTFVDHKLAYILAHAFHTPEEVVRLIETHSGLGKKRTKEEEPEEEESENESIRHLAHLQPSFLLSPPTPIQVDEQDASDSNDIYLTPPPPPPPKKSKP